MSQSNALLSPAEIAKVAAVIRARDLRAGYPCSPYAARIAAQNLANAWQVEHRAGKAIDNVILREAGIAPIAAVPVGKQIGDFLASLGV